MSNSYTISPIVGSYMKPKYRVISNVLGESFSPEYPLDIFLDLNTIVTVLSSASKFLNSLPFSDDAEKDIVSSILFAVKHWKDYSRKFSDVRIFLIVNDFEMRPLPEQDLLHSYLLPYVNKFHNERFAQMTYYWTEAMKKIEVVLKYVPQSYLIRTNFVDSYIVPNIVSDEKRMKLIVTGNPLFTSYQYIPNAKVIYSRYVRNGTSQMTDPIMICRTISKIDDDIMATFCQNRVFYNLLQSIIGNFDRGIMGMPQVGISNFALTLVRMIDRHKIPKDPKSLEMVLPAIDDAYQEYVKQAYPLIDVDTHTKMIPPSLIEKTKGLLIDLIDIDGLQRLSVDGMNLLELL